VSVRSDISLTSSAFNVYYYVPVFTVGDVVSQIL